MALIPFALAACGGPGAPSDGSNIRPNATSAAVTDCGTFNLSQGEGLPDSAIRCFVEAVQARHPAQLKETRLTVEGDPIPVTYTADAAGRVEVITDTRQDRLGERTIDHQTCAVEIVYACF
ncbi:MAG TPA: hypothetical protein VGJ95_12945 [Pseudonocardiaceae bacterium]